MLTLECLGDALGNVNVGPFSIARIRLHQLLDHGVGDTHPSASETDCDPIGVEDACLGKRQDSVADQFVEIESSLFAEAAAVDPRRTSQLRSDRLEGAVARAET